MTKHAFIGILAGTLVCVGCLQPGLANAQYQMDAATSARAMAMEGAGSTLDDPWAGTINPGALAPGMKDRLSFFGRYHADYRYAGHNLNSFISIASPTINLGDSPTSPSVRLAYAYRAQRAIATTVWNNSDNHTVSVAVDYGLTVGAGYAWRRITAGRSTIHLNAHDVGLYAQAPVLHLVGIARGDNRVPRIGGLTPEITGAVGYTWAYRGNELDMTRFNSFEVPEYRVFGLRASGALRHHTHVVGEITFVRDLVEYPASVRPKSDRMGWEVNALGIFAYRGSVHSELTSHGISVHSSPAVEWLYVAVTGNGDALPPWYLDLFDFYYDDANITYGPWMEDNAWEIGIAMNAMPLFAK